jgi:hypothetical protein
LFSEAPKRVHVDVNNLPHDRLATILFRSTAGEKQSLPSGIREDATGQAIRPSDGKDVHDSTGSSSLALIFNWLTLHSASSMSSRTLPKYFACMSFPSGPGWQ